jgi:excisionase family DNA binding protein
MNTHKSSLPTTSDCSLSPASLAIRWECSVMTVKRRIKAGHLKAQKNGRLVRIPLSEVIRFETAALC